MGVIKDNPNSPSQNIIQATADVPDLTLRPFSDAQTSPVLRVQNAAGTQDLAQITPTGDVTAAALQIGPDPSGGASQNWVTAGTDVLDGFTCGVNPNTTTPGNGDYAFSVRDRNGSLIFAAGDSGAGGSATFFSQDPGDIALAAQGKAGQTNDIFVVFTAAGHRPFRVGDDTIGFLGAPAVVRQVGASAAALAAITDPNAKAALQAIQTALANLGLVTSPA